MGEVSQMKPFPGENESTLPGGRAWKKERDYLQNGIPIAAKALESLGMLAGEFELDVPW